MKTFDLKQAAAFLRCHPQELRARAKAGKIPGARIGRAWVFLEEDLAEHIRSRYPVPRKALQVTLRKESECHYANAAVSGGSTSSLPTGNEYAELLGLPTKPSRKNSMIGSSPTCGASSSLARGREGPGTTRRSGG